jgi:hypothetical protein
MEKLMEDFKLIPIPKGHICKSVSVVGIVDNILNTKLGLAFLPRMQKILYQ